MAAGAAGRWCLAGVLLLPGSAVAATGDAEGDWLVGVRAGFLRNIARATRWPSADAGEPFDVVFLNDGPLAEAFVEAVAGRPIRGRPVVVTRIDLPPPCGDPAAERAAARAALNAAAGAEVLCFGRLPTQRRALLAAALLEPEQRVLPRLLVCSLPWGAEVGLSPLALGEEDGRVRLVSSAAASDRSRIPIGSRLLALAERLP